MNPKSASEIQRKFMAYTGFTDLEDPNYESTERLYKVTTAASAQFLTSHPEVYSLEEELAWVKELCDIGINIAELINTEDDGDTENTDSNNEEIVDEPDEYESLEQDLTSLRARFQDKLHYVQIHCRPIGQNYRRLQNLGEYDHLAALSNWIFKPKASDSGFLLEQNWGLKGFRACLKEPKKGLGKQYLNALCDFISANATSLDATSFNRFAAIIRKVFLAYLNDKRVPIDPPKLRSHMTYWLFLMNPERYHFLKSNRSWRDISDRSRSQSNAEFTASVYAEILKEAEASRLALDELQPRDFIDLHSILWAVNGGYDSPDESDPPIDNPRPINTTGGYMMETLERCSQLLQVSRQIILYGPPGTGKTRLARQLAAHLLRLNTVRCEMDDAVSDRLSTSDEGGLFKMVVFHPSYEYDQFIGGLTVDVDSGSLRYKQHVGPFLSICQHASEYSDRKHILLIDEINRGNLPKLMGELLYALEYRGNPVTLSFAWSKGKLVVPENLYIVATMNSSDRSIGHIDVATRRRFSHFHLSPDEDAVTRVWTDKFEDHGETGKKLAEVMRAVNKILVSVQSEDLDDLGVGQSYFLPHSSIEPDPESIEEALSSVLLKANHELLPLLHEYAKIVGAGLKNLARSKPFATIQEFLEWRP